MRTEYRMTEMVRERQRVTVYVVSNLPGWKVPPLLGMSHPASWLHLKMEKEMDRPGHLNFRTLAI